MPDWAAGLSGRSVTFFDTPLIGGLLELVDKSWEVPAAGRELMRLIVYLVGQEKNPDGFRNTVISAADLFQLLEDTGRIAPLLQLSAEAVAPGVSNFVKNGEGKADANGSLLRKLGGASEPGDEAAQATPHHAFPRGEESRGGYPRRQDAARDADRHDQRSRAHQARSEARGLAQQGRLQEHRDQRSHRS